MNHIILELLLLLSLIQFLSQLVLDFLRFDEMTFLMIPYHVCDDCNGPCSISNENKQYDPNRPGAKKGEMYYYESSHLPIEWTQQHGCGKGNRNLNCEIILQ